MTIATFLIVLNLNCGYPTMVNNTLYDWNDIDIKAMNQARKTCVIEYDSCLKKFIKRDVQTYWAIC
jgi:hypothetical protein